MNPNQRAASWVFTVNNYKPEHVIMLQSLSCSFMVFGYEVAPSTGTSHLQGYFEVKEGTRRATLSKRLPPCWFDTAVGDNYQNIAYCLKSGKFWSSNEVIMGIPIPPQYATWSKDNQFNYVINVATGSKPQDTLETIERYIKDNYNQ